MYEERLRAPERTVPFLDLAPSHEGLKADLLGAISDLIDTGAFTNGPAVAEFERAFAAYCGTAYCVGTASGLDALRLGLLAAQIAPGDEVVVPAMTFVATLEAVTQAGGRPVIADVRHDDYGLDPAAAEAALSPRTRFLLPVHLYGQLADMHGLRAVASTHGLRVLEDACQAHGAERDGLRAGAAGDVAAFSFYPGKNLGAFGDGGAVVTDDEHIAARIRAAGSGGVAACASCGASVSCQGWRAGGDRGRGLGRGRRGRAAHPPRRPGGRGGVAVRPGGVHPGRRKNEPTSHPAKPHPPV